LLCNPVKFCDRPINGQSAPINAEYTRFLRPVSSLNDQIFTDQTNAACLTFETYQTCETFQQKPAVIQQPLFKISNLTLLLQVSDCFCLTLIQSHFFNPASLYRSLSNVTSRPPFSQQSRIPVRPPPGMNWSLQAFPKPQGSIKPSLKQTSAIRLLRGREGWWPSKHQTKAPGQQAFIPEAEPVVISSLHVCLYFVFDIPSYLFALIGYSITSGKVPW